MGFKVTKLGSGFAVVQATDDKSAMDLDLLLDSNAIIGMFQAQATASQAALGLDSGGRAEVIIDSPSGKQRSVFTTQADLNNYIAACKSGNVPIIYVGPFGSYLG